MSPWWSKPTSDTDDTPAPSGPLSVADGLAAAEAVEEEEEESEAIEAAAPKKSRRRRSRRGKAAESDAGEAAEAATDAQGEDVVEPGTPSPSEAAPPAAEAEPEKPKRRSRRSAKPKAEAASEDAVAAAPAPPQPSPASAHRQAKHETAPRLDRPAPPRLAEPARDSRAEPRTDLSRSDGRSDSAPPSWGQIRDLLREVVGATGGPVEHAVSSVAVERKIALFCDLENLVLGIKDSEADKFDIDLVLERLVEKGKIIVKRAYADWSRYTEYKRAFHEAGIELIDIPQRQYSGKNSADIKMVVDAMDISWSKEHLDTFVVLSGDSDFTPLVTKLKENDKRVIGLGLKASSSNLLIDNCDEFVYYEDLWRDGRQKKVAPSAGLTKKEAELATLLTESVQALEREGKSVLWGSMVKQTMQRKKPAFNESYYGFSTFSALLEDAEKKGLVKLRRDARSGSWVIAGLGSKRA